MLTTEVHADIDSIIIWFLYMHMLMRVRLGCLSVHEHTSRFARRNHIDDDVQGQAPCLACGATVESVARLMFECPVTTTAARAQMYHVIKASVNGESKLQQCLNLSCDKKKVARFVSCDMWNDKHALVSKAIAMFLQNASGIRNAYKNGTPVDVFESTSERRGADGIDARA
jgi:hypothetical protein